MKLHTYFRSSAAFRVRIALNLKRIGYESIAQSLLKHEHRDASYLALNPHGLIPALEVEGSVISQSLAIIEYLNDKHPTPPLLPAAPLDRAIVRSMALAVACDIHPLNNLRVLNYLRDELQQPADSVNLWYRHWVSLGFQGLEAQVGKYSSTKRFCFGDTVTLADVCLAPQMFNARRFDVDLRPFPALTAISAHLEALPEFTAARPEAQPDAT